MATGNLSFFYANTFAVYAFVENVMQIFGVLFKRENGASHNF